MSRAVDGAEMIKSRSRLRQVVDEHHRARAVSAVVKAGGEA